MSNPRRRQASSRSIFSRCRQCIISRCRCCTCCKRDGDEGEEGVELDVSDIGCSEGDEHCVWTDLSPNPLDQWDRPKVIMGGGKSYEEIKKECLSAGKLYEDPDFRPSRQLLEQNPNFMYQIEWKRPKEIYGSSPVFVYGDKDYYDMDQGILGNCWFVSSVACIVASPQKELIRRVVPLDQGFDRSEYCGAFHFFFWQFGKWVEVIVDDRLPTLNGQLAYGHNRDKPNEYWCPLLEKAFAKLRGNYDNINGGRTFDGMVDLTGGIGELLRLRGDISTEKLTKILVECRKMNSCMGGAIFLKSNTGGREHLLANGLYEGHAYSIINVKKARSSKHGEVILLHLRNPWGRGEWTGAWSDRSAEYQTLTSDDMRATMRKRVDGEFWISVDDFRKNFDELELCHLTPDAFTGELARNLDRTQWKTREFFNQWIPGRSAGGPFTSWRSPYFWTNPQFELDLSKNDKGISLITSLFLIPENYGEDSDISTAFVVFKFEEDGPVPRITASNSYKFKHIAFSGAFWPYRERAYHCFLQPGRYVIIPCTFKRGKRSKFYLRIFSDEKVQSEEIAPPPTEPQPERIQPTAGKEETATETQPLVEFIKKAGTGGVVDAYGLKDILNKSIEDMKFSLGTCRSLAIYANNTYELGMVNKQQFEKIWNDLLTWRSAFRALDKNQTGQLEPSELIRLFEVLDYGDVAKDAVNVIINKFGGKAKALTEDDFFQSFAQINNLTKVYKELKDKGQLTMEYPQWITVSILT